MNKKNSWHPGTSNKLIRYRSDVYRQIRAFFFARNVLEVSTPLLGVTGVTDLGIQSLRVIAGGRSLSLQTSPEFYMKRLLAADSGPIYQICSAFRQDESGRFHNQEFSLLEWYRPGFELDDLMSELEELIWSVTHTESFQKRTYRELFEEEFGVNPHTLDAAALLSICHQNYSSGTEHLQSNIERRTRENCLDLLFARTIQPNLMLPSLVTHFPSSQSALAETAQIDGDEVALRFELFWEGIELANGYSELRDPSVLASRMESDNRDRETLGLEKVQVDEKLLQAMESGLPECCGVALGLDRLLMILTASESLDQVMTFVSDRL